MEAEKKFEIFKAHNTGKPVICPPIKPRSIAEYDVPGAHFNPTELNLQEGLTEKEWMAVGRAVAHIGQSTHWWIGDLLQYGFRAYGKKVSFDLAQQCTGTTRTFLYTVSYVSKRFPPARRVAALTFFHHFVVASFPPDVADRLLAEALELGLTARQIRKHGEEECGKQKLKGEVLKKVRVFLMPSAYEKLQEHAGSMPVSSFIAQICDEFLTGRPVERYANGRKRHPRKAEMQEEMESEGL